MRRQPEPCRENFGHRAQHTRRAPGAIRSTAPTQVSAHALARPLLKLTAMTKSPAHPVAELFAKLFVSCVVMASACAGPLPDEATDNPDDENVAGKTGTIPGTGLTSGQTGGQTGT